MSSDASASTDSNTYYEDDFSSTEEDSSQGRGLSSLSQEIGYRVQKELSPVGSSTFLLTIFFHPPSLDLIIMCTQRWHVIKSKLSH